MPIKPGYSSGKFAVELDGILAGFLDSVEGGEVFGEVEVEPVGVAQVRRKHITGVKWSPITLRVGAGLSSQFYDWITEFLAGTPSTQSGAVLFLDYQLKETQRLEWSNGVITEVSFPPFDASSKDDALISLTIAPESAFFQQSAGNAVAGLNTKKQKKWSTSNFRFNLSGLETASKKVKQVEALTLRYSEAPAGGIAPPTVLVPNVFVTLPAADATPYTDWVHDFIVQGNHDDSDERSGSIELLDQTLQETQFTLQLEHVGIVRARRLRTEGKSAVVAEVEVELYCESVAFVVAPDAIAGDSVGPGIITPQPVGATPGGAPVTAATDALLALLLRDRGIDDARRSLSNALRSESLVAASPEARARLVAARLEATSAVRSAGFGPKREDGVALGERWASERAALGELDEITNLGTGNWTALRLASDHSLIAQLQDANLIPAGADGAFELDRDDFVEGLIAGAANVRRIVTPHLKSPGGNGEARR